MLLKPPFKATPAVHAITARPPPMSRYWILTASARGPNTIMPRGRAQEVDICMKLNTLPCMEGSTRSWMDTVTGD